MFGAKVDQRRSIIHVLMKALIMLGNKVGYGHDQDLLGKVFWPIVKDDAVRTWKINFNEKKLTESVVIFRSFTTATFAIVTGIRYLSHRFRHSESI